MGDIKIFCWRYEEQLRDIQSRAGMDYLNLGYRVVGFSPQPIPDKPGEWEACILFVKD
jgi:hypothetical protein